jgi:phosphotransferase system HPr (HPr) family protein
MSGTRVTRTVTILNSQGLHARPAEMFAKCASRFASCIMVIKEGNRVDAKSILHVLTLAAESGTVLVLEADGIDAEDALEALSQLVESGFALDGNTSQQQSG